MKITQLLVVMVFVLAFQSASALRIDIKNDGAKPIKVCPEWTGIVRDWKEVSPGGDFRYDSGVHTLRKLYVRYWNIGCFEYNFGPKGFNGTGKLTIGIDPGALVIKGALVDPTDLVISVNGHTDAMFQKLTAVKQTFSNAMYRDCKFSSGIGNLEN